MTRVTHKTIQDSTLANLQRGLTAMSRLQEQLSTGRKINRPSDDPTGTVSSLQVRSDLRATEQAIRNADDGIAWLSVIDTQLQTASERIGKASALVVQALNDTTGTGGREAIAIELETIRDTLLGVANTDYLGRPVFAGTAPAPAVTVAAGPPASYTWSDTAGGTVVRRVDGATEVRVDSPGVTVFGADDPVAGTTSVFAVLDDVIASLRDGTISQGHLSELQGKLEPVLAELSASGARYAQIEGARQRAEDRTLALRTSLSDLESIDLPETIVNLQMQEVAYKAALGATAKVLQPSLMDFLG